MDKMLEQMPASMLTEWAAFFKMRNDDFKNKRTQDKLKGDLRKRKGRK